MTMNGVRKFLYMAAIFTAAVLVLLGYSAIRTYRVYIDGVELRDRLSGRIVKADVSDSLSLKDNDIVWVSGNLTASAPVLVSIRNKGGSECCKFSRDAVCARYQEQKYVDSKHPYWDTRFEKLIAPDSVLIGSLPVDTAIVRHSMTDYQEAYNQEIGEDYRVVIDVIPLSGISCIAMWRSGRLCRTGDNDPFLYSLKTGVSSVALMNSYVNNAEDEMNDSRYNALVFLAIFVAEAIAILLMRKKGDYRYSIEFQFLRRKATNINLLRYGIFIMLVLVNLLCVGAIDHFSRDSIDSLLMLLIVAGISMIVVYYIAGAAEKYLLCRYYKKAIVGEIVSRHNELITPLKETVTGENFNKFGIIKPLENVNSFFKESVNYSFNEEDAYTIKSRDREFKFHELFIKETRGSGRHEKTKNILRSFCLKIPVSDLNDLRMNVMPEKSVCHAQLTTYQPSTDKASKLLPGMKFVCNDEAKMNNYLENTHILETLKTIRETMQKMMQENNLHFTLTDGFLYVFALTEADRFDISLYSHLTLQEVARDYYTIDAMSEIGRQMR